MVLIGRCKKKKEVRGMKRVLCLTVLILAVMGGVPVAYGDQLKVALFLPGNLGDMGFFDSAARGVKMAAEELGIQYTIIEAGPDPAAWGPGLEDVAYGPYDVVITGAPPMATHVERVAVLLPDKHFILFDTQVNYERHPELTNVYSILYKQNEGAFLAGALAALVTTSDMPKANPEPIIGFIGGQDYPVINDFLVGYIQGAQYINPEIKVLIAYAGTFSDPAKGKELALAQYRAGADIVFPAAAMTSLGALEAAKEIDKYAIGVDDDQSLIFTEKLGDTETAEHILSSALKKVDVSLFQALKLHVTGKLPYGQAEAWGIAEGAVGLADNLIYRTHVPESFRKTLTELEQKILAGEIIVRSAFGMSPQELDAMRQAVKP